ncbi:hypothetical protein ARAM_001325 [Aspergillus rambellii]|uniref:Autophagy-related protein 16 domain-containing protein n=1 Tax=Aspergillus rambellii TaxID=308745 RepID=A0A0F8UVR7_9EURO|nr:hypothetical protein ARAM_001325 [Aspergillus rambellii]
MAHWREEYAAALAARDRREKANISIYNACAKSPFPSPADTKLADRTASLNAETNNAQGPTSAGNRATRADLVEAQRSRSELEDRLGRVTIELEKLRKRSTYDGKRISSMEGEITHVQLRLKDRDEELRGKAKLLEDFQDELATLNLQLNMAEERTDRLRKENQDLVDRWMARMGKEADAMNDASKFS